MLLTISHFSSLYSNIVLFRSLILHSFIVPPRILAKPEDTTVRSGNTIFFRCEATGAPKPVISWIKDGVQVSKGNRFSVNSNTGELEIRDIGKEDEGRWECAARNSIGFASEVFELRVIGERFDYK